MLYPAWYGVPRPRPAEPLDTLVVTHAYQGRNQNFAKGRGGLKMENFCDVILMTYLGDVI